MINQHTTLIPVRHYECDAYGHVNNTNYLRYMEEAALHAAAEAGCDLTEDWREISAEIEFLKPLRYGDTAEILTTLTALEGTLARLAFELRTGTDENASARGWITFDAGNAGPEEVAALAAFFSPYNQESNLDLRAPFAPAPPPPLGVYRMQRKALFHEVNARHEALPASYLDYVEECGMEVIAAHEWPLTRMLAEKLAILIRRHQIEFLEPARLDAALEVATWASHVTRVSAIRHYVVSRAVDGVELARVHSLGVWVDMTSGRPIRIPAHFMASFAPNIVE